MLRTLHSSFSIYHSSLITSYILLLVFHFSMRTAYFSLITHSSPFTAQVLTPHFWLVIPHMPLLSTHHCTAHSLHFTLHSLLVTSHFSLFTRFSSLVITHLLLLHTPWCSLLYLKQSSRVVRLTARVTFM